MLQANHRYILYFDLAMVPYPADAPALPLNDFAPHLDKRCKEGLSFQVIDNDRRVVRLSQMKFIRTKGGKPAVALLLALGDRDKAEPGFTNFETGAVRIVKPEAGEAGGLSVHAVLSLSPTTPNGHVYRMVYEDVSGFGRTLIQNFLRAEFRIIATEQGLTFPREGAGEIKTRPLVELSGHASERLKESLAQGRLLHIELVRYQEENLGFDEQKYIQKSTQDMRLSISKALPRSESLNLVEKVKVWANSNNYVAMRVRWRENGKSKPESAKVDTARRDAGEALFIKSAEISLNNILPDISESISDELVDKIKDMVE